MFGHVGYSVWKNWFTTSALLKSLVQKFCPNRFKELVFCWMVIAKKYGANRLVFDPLLVGGIPTNPSEKYEFVSWDDEIPNCFWKVIKFHSSKPPTRWSLRTLLWFGMKTHLQRPAGPVHLRLIAKVVQCHHPSWSRPFWHRTSKYRSHVGAVRYCKPNNQPAPVCWWWNWIYPDTWDDFIHSLRLWLILAKNYQLVLNPRLWF